MRALQRGGVTAEIRPDTWGVWRTKDRRRCTIGTLPGREIELMKLSEHLKVAANSDTVVWVWNRDTVPLTELALMEMNSHPPRPLLIDLILKCHAAMPRKTLSRAAISFRQDVARVRGNDKYRMEDEAGAEACASIRLSRVRDALSHEDHAFLDDMVLRKASKARLSKAFELRPAATVTKALDVLRELTQIYR